MIKQCVRNTENKSAAVQVFFLLQHQTQWHIFNLLTISQFQMPGKNKYNLYYMNDIECELLQERETETEREEKDY